MLSIRFGPRGMIDLEFISDVMVRTKELCSVSGRSSRSAFDGQRSGIHVLLEVHLQSMEFSPNKLNFHLITL